MGSLFYSRSSGPSGHSSGSSSFPAWRPARLQRCLGGVLPSAGRLLRHSQPSDDGCSTTSPSGTSPIRICPPHPLNTQIFGALTPPLLTQVLQGSSHCSSFTNLTKPISSLHRFLSFLIWEAESTVSAVNMQCIFYVFFCTGPVMWSGHKVNATLSKQNPLLNVWMQTPWWRS